MGSEGISDDATVAAYHEQDREGAFPKGRLNRDLHLLWSGDRDRIAAILRSHGLCVKVPASTATKFVVHPVDAFTCPRCGGGIPTDAQRSRYPGAISRWDNATQVCSRCGQEEALLQFTGCSVHPVDGDVPWVFAPGVKS
jgi:hypothetical protein